MRKERTTLKKGRYYTHRLSFPTRLILGIFIAVGYSCPKPVKEMRSGPPTELDIKLIKRKGPFIFYRVVNNYRYPITKGFIAVVEGLDCSTPPTRRLWLQRVKTVIGPAQRREKFLKLPVFCRKIELAAYDFRYFSRKLPFLLKPIVRYSFINPQTIDIKIANRGLLPFRGTIIIIKKYGCQGPQNSGFSYLISKTRLYPGYVR